MKISDKKPSYFRSGCEKANPLKLISKVRCPVLNNTSCPLRGHSTDEALYYMKRLVGLN